MQIQDKQYNGLKDASFAAKPDLVGTVDGDTVILTEGIPTFDSVGVSDRVPVSLTDFAILGADAGNYYLTQPKDIFGRIYNTYEAVQGTDYTVNSNGWLKEEFVITAAAGYSLSLTDTAEGSWEASLRVSDEAANGTLAFYVKDSSGAISTETTESYWIDKTPPEGGITIGGNSWREFLNTITFGHFFKDTQTVRITGEDALSGVATVEYAAYQSASGEALTLAEVKELSWTEKSSVNVTPEDGKKFVYYARITDNVGNVTYLSTDGVEYDTTLPVIRDITEGNTYCLSVPFTVVEEHIKEVTTGTTVLVPDENGIYTLTAGKHTVTATDEAGNTAAVTVTVNAAHTGTDDGDCTTEVRCSVCGELIEAGNASHDLTYTANGDGTHAISCASDGCQYTSAGDCAGGTATCVERAVCSVCGGSYGTVDASRHTNLVKTEAKPATHLTEGNTAYWYCGGCGKYFSDGAGTKEIALADTVIPKLTEHTPDGTGWHADAEDHWRICECGETIDRAAHSYTEGICTLCGALDPDYGKPEPPFIKGEDGKQGWEVIKGETEQAGEGDTVEVDMNGTTLVPGDVLDTIKGKDITIVFHMEDDITWTVNGQSITTDHVADIDFGVTTGTDAIPIDIINNVTGERYTLQISLAYDGEFGLTAILTVNLEAENAGYYANLFYYHEEENKLEFMTYGQIGEDGSAELAFTHASDYAIVIDDKILDGREEPDNAAGETEASGEAPDTATATPESTPAGSTDLYTAPKTGEAESGRLLLGIFAAVLAAAAAAGGILFLAFKRKKQEDEE